MSGIGGAVGLGLSRGLSQARLEVDNIQAQFNAALQHANSTVNALAHRTYLPTKITHKKIEKVNFDYKTAFQALRDHISDWAKL